MLKTFDYILGAIEGATGIIASLGVGGPALASIAGLADYFLKIAQAAVKAHEAVTGKPLDLSLLHDIKPLP